jgi:hypothetical protein
MADTASQDAIFLCAWWAWVMYRKRQLTPAVVDTHVRAMTRVCGKICLVPAGCVEKGSVVDRSSGKGDA